MGYRPKHMAYSPRNELAFRLGMAVTLSATLVCATPAFAAEAQTSSSTAQQTQASTAAATETAQDASLSSTTPAATTATTEEAVSNESAAATETKQTASAATASSDSSTKEDQTTASVEPAASSSSTESFNAESSSNNTESAASESQPTSTAEASEKSADSNDSTASNGASDTETSTPTASAESDSAATTASEAVNTTAAASAKVQALSANVETEEKTELDGIDISGYQKGIDIAAVPSDFVIVKVSEGTSSTATFKEQADAALKAGKLLGLYHFANADTTASAQAEFFADSVKDYLGKALLFLDWEDTYYSKVREKGTSWAAEWLERVYKLTGVKPLIYMNKNATREYDFSDIAKEYKLWAAQYADMDAHDGYQDDPWQDTRGYGAWGSAPTIFQYSSTTHLDGYDGNLDVDKFYGSKSDWTALAASDAADSANSSISVQVPTLSIVAAVEGGKTVSAYSGQIAGTTGQGKKLEAITVHLLVPEGMNCTDSDIEYRVHVENIGWEDWVSGGTTVGQAGSGLRIEAIQFRLKEGSDLASSWTIWARGHVENQGWLAWTSSMPVGSTGQALRLEAIELQLLKSSAATPDDSSYGDFSSTQSYPFIDGTNIAIEAHVQNIGWQSWACGGATAGTTGRGLRIEALRAQVDNAYLSGGIEYETHVQDIGWQSWVSDGEIAGTTGQSKRVEALRFSLTGDLADAYDVWYRVHVQDIGWMAWTSNGAAAGTTGASARIEAIQVVLVAKGSGAPSSTGSTTTLSYVSAPSIEYSAHVQDIGWQNAVEDGAVAGTTNRSLHLEAYAAYLGSSSDNFSGSVTYRAHVQDTGWQSWVSDGAVAGTTGQSKQAEAIQMKLSGEISRYFDIYYQVYVQGLGWLGWASNGEMAGTTGLSRAIEAYRVELVLKSNAAPGRTSGHYYNQTSSI